VLLLETVVPLLEEVGVLPLVVDPSVVLLVVDSPVVDFDFGRLVVVAKVEELVDGNFIVLGVVLGVVELVGLEVLVLLVVTVVMGGFVVVLALKDLISMLENDDLKVVVQECLFCLLRKKRYPVGGCCFVVMIPLGVNDGFVGDFAGATDCTVVIPANLEI